MDIARFVIASALISFKACGKIGSNCRLLLFSLVRLLYWLTIALVLGILVIAALSKRFTHLINWDSNSGTNNNSCFLDISDQSKFWGSAKHGLSRNSIYFSRVKN